MAAQAEARLSRKRRDARHRRGVRWLLPAAAVVSLSVASACDGHGRRAATTTTRPRATTSTGSTTTLDPKQAQQAAVVAAYQEFWKVWLEANDPPNPDYPKLSEVAAQDELTTVKQAIASKVSNGLATRLPDNPKWNHAVQGVSITPPQALVIDCEVDDSQVLRPATGEIVDAEVETSSLLASLTEIEGRWRVTSIRVQGRWPGATACK
jgi:hypothetical protein